MASSSDCKITRNDAERLFRHLVLRNVIEEDLVIGQHENVICYVKLGSKASDVHHGRMKVHFVCLFLHNIS